MSSIKIGIVGIGSAGRVHAEQYEAHPRAQVAAACARTKDDLEEFGRERHIPTTYTDYRQMAEDPQIQAVSICTPTALHLPMAELMLEKGKHVLVEKPIGISADECRQMIDAADRSKCKLQAGNMWRFHPEVQFVKSVVDAGTIGRIVKAKSYGIHVNWGPGRWFINKELAGGGILVDMGIHAINTMRFMLGDARARSVFARLDTLYGSYDVDDSCVLTIEFESGAIGLIEAGMWHPHADGKEASTQLFGTEGYARVFPTEVKHSIGKTWGTFTPIVVDDSAYPMPVEHNDPIMHKRQIAHFLDCIEQDKTPMTDGRMALEDMKIIDAAYESSATNTLVRVQ